MKHLIIALFLCLALPLSALADPSKAVQTVGEAELPDRPFVGGAFAFAEGHPIAWEVRELHQRFLLVVKEVLRGHLPDV